MKVVVGGTFDYLHIGHQELLKTAFRSAGENGDVIIGLSSDDFAGRKNHPVRPYDVRKNELEAWIADSGFTAAYVIEPLYDAFGPALTIEFDVLVVSYETYPTGELINEKRKNAGKKEVTLSIVPCLTAEDGKEVSTSRIYKGEIDRFGKSRIER
ncbi:MAG TPA: phosphopantetheine adenylyltransferase [Methanocorpusculum sp.]|nr:phosphopantetheine adenylyltransferase [Methanocorpusculum sp.]